MFLLSKSARGWDASGDGYQLVEMDPELSHPAAPAVRVPDFCNGAVEVEDQPGATWGRPVLVTGTSGDEFGSATDAWRLPGSQGTPGSPLGAKGKAFERLDRRKGRGGEPRLFLHEATIDIILPLERNKFENFSKGRTFAINQ